MSVLTQEQANKLLQEKVTAAYAAIREAEAIADEYKLSFSFDVAYGMGGYYEGDVEPGQKNYWGEEVEPGWRPSSQSC